MTTRVRERLALPPPLSLTLHDGDRTVGWVRGDAVGFHGFADETEAAHAAWVAYRALARRHARTHGTRPPPIDTEPLALHRRADEESILASGRPIATLVRPDLDGRSGADTFGFEIRVPHPADELRVRAMGHLMYRTLRKSGVRWAMWRPAVSPAPPAAEVVAARPAAERRRESTQRVPRKLAAAASLAAVGAGGAPALFARRWT